MISKPKHSHCAKHSQQPHSLSKQQSNPNVQQSQTSKLKAQNDHLLSELHKLVLENGKLKKQNSTLRTATSKQSIQLQNTKQPVLKSQLDELNKLHNKTKKQLQRITQQNQQLIKKNNQYRNKLFNSQKQIGTLKTIQSSKGFHLNKQQKISKKSSLSKIQPISQSSSKQLPPKPTSQIDIIKLNQEKKTLQRRIQLYQRQRKNIENTFQPIIQQTNEQLKTIIQEKTRLMAQNANKQKDINMLNIQIGDLTTKNVRLIQIMNKQQPKQQPKQDNNEQNIRIIQEYEQKVKQLQGLFENAQKQIEHLENVGRYLANENKKLLSK